MPAIGDLRIIRPVALRVFAEPGQRSAFDVTLGDVNLREW